MKRIVGSLAIALASSLIVTGSSFSSAITPSNSNLAKRLSACGAIPNGTSLPVVQTTRLFLFLPKDYFPNIKLKITSHGASAGSVSSAGSYGYAQSANAKSGCWSYYLDFELTPSNKSSSGTVDIGSTNVLKTLSNYLIHFKVTKYLPDATKLVVGNGNVQGQVLLSPVCPVEHNPPDINCAPRGYKTTLNVWSTGTGSAYKPVATSSAGIFKLSLAPGQYVVKVQKEANGSMYPRCPETKFLVTAKKTLKLTVNCDTGIR